MKITTKKRAIQNVGLIFLGIFLGLFILEIGLRISGYFLLGLQRSENKINFERGDVYRILALGESTTANLYNGQGTWPEELETILNKRSNDIKFKVLNEGISGISTSDILLNLKENLDRYNPDMVITLIGINDVALYIDKRTFRGKLKMLFKDFRVYKLIKRGIEGVRYNLMKKKDAQKEMEYKETENRLKEAIQANPESINALAELGKFYETHNNIKLLDVLKKILELEPNYFQNFNELGTVFHQAKMYEEAEEMFKKAINVNPNDFGAYFGLGDIYRDWGKADKAINMYKMHLNTRGKYNEYAFIQIAKLYMGMNKSKDAYELLKTIVLINPQKIEEIFMIGQIYDELNKTDDAINLFKLTAKKNPDNHAAYIELALHSLNNGKLEEAEEIFNAMIERKPSHSTAYIEPGWYYLNNDKISKAEEIFSILLEKNPSELAVVYGSIATRYQKKGQFEKADEMFDRALNLRKNYYSSQTTEQNYLELYRILSERGIKLVVMQYPTLEINQLKEMFNGNDEIIFISNEENFKKFLEGSEYEEYFIDSFGGTFGHATNKGNKLIAENVANTILDNAQIVKN